MCPVRSIAGSHRPIVLSGTVMTCVTPTSERSDAICSPENNGTGYRVREGGRVHGEVLPAKGSEALNIRTRNSANSSHPEQSEGSSSSRKRALYREPEDLSLRR